jgi:hypothetical protein
MSLTLTSLLSWDGRARDHVRRLHGWVERWQRLLRFSFRGLFSIIVASYSFQTEFALVFIWLHYFSRCVPSRAISLIMSPAEPLAFNRACPSTAITTSHYVRGQP